MRKQDDDRKVVRIRDYIGFRRKRQPAQEAPLPELDEAMRDLHAAARTAMRLVLMARERLRLPPL